MENKGKDSLFDNDAEREVLSNIRCTLLNLTPI